MPVQISSKGGARPIAPSHQLRLSWFYIVERAIFQHDPVRGSAAAMSELLPQCANSASRIQFTKPCLEAISAAAARVLTPSFR